MVRRCGVVMYGNVMIYNVCNAMYIGKTRIKYRIERSSLANLNPSTQLRRKVFYKSAIWSGLD